MKSSDLPILQFFSKKSSETIHEIIEDIDDDDEDEDDDLPIENPHTEDCSSKFVDDDSNSSTTTCPVCQKMLLGDNDKINKHIDLCLNGEMIRTTIKEDEQQQQQTTTSHKRTTQSKSTPSAKRQRKNLPITTPERNHGIDNYFYKTDLK
jgi:hypothetical protein